MNENEKFEVVLSYETYEQPITGQLGERRIIQKCEFKIPISISGFAGIKKEEKNIEFCFDNDYPAKSVSIKSILSSPTLSQLVYSMNMKENMLFFLGFYNVYIEDAQGTKFKGGSGQSRFFPNENFIREGKDEFIEISGGGSSSIHDTDGRRKLNIIPSFYNSGIDLNKLCFEGINVMEKKRFTLNIKGSFPQYIAFGDRTVTVNSAEYKDGNLIIRLKKFTPDFQEVTISDWDNTSNKSRGGHIVKISGDDKTGECIITCMNNKTVLDETGKSAISHDTEQVPFEKKDKYDLTVEAKFTVKKKVEIPLGK